MPGYDLRLPIKKHWDIKAKGLNALRDLAYLLLRVEPWIFGVGLELSDQTIDDAESAYCGLVCSICSLLKLVLIHIDTSFT
jgi:hypothetical protein